MYLRLIINKTPNKRSKDWWNIKKQQISLKNTPWQPDKTWRVDKNSTMVATMSVNSLIAKTPN